MSRVYGENFIRDGILREWFREFKDERTNVHDEEEQGHKVSIKVLLPHMDLRTATTITTNLVSRYSKVTMRYTVRSVTAPPGGNGVSVLISKTVQDMEKSQLYSVFDLVQKDTLSASSARPSRRVRSPTENHEPAQDFQRGSSSPAPYMRADGPE
ncbi:hypothetical protein AVEN_199116-1 [Araneus ventricosus]|uniref:Mos1 transposase HTH domain-containing protein n=1 Tax=Araneus ventricosus TaxID=182803 RepID=A0A4Y2SC43_ARAVE|nr:hypothetical protein AVEN_2180-1 [Araneus ventricosus]GBN84879.1 hypothetical protein AVEN_199116-1 [Araneus ventricosus]